MPSPSSRRAPAGQCILINGSYAPSLLNFRGPLLRELVARGHKVHVSAPQIDAEIQQELRSIGVVTHDLPLERTGRGLAGDWAYLRALRRVMRQVRPDLVLGYTVKPNIWGSFAARMERVPSYSWITGLGYVFIEGDGFGRKLTQKLAQKLYRIATGFNRRVIFQNSDDMRDFISAGCLADPSRAALVNGSGVDTSHYSATDLPNAPVFLMIARLLRSKGLQEYGEAARLLKAKLPDAHFQLAGMLDEGPDAISAAELQHLVSAGIEYLGELRDVRPSIAAASVYVLPSWREGTPRTVLEAMAMGRAIITTDAPGCRQTTVDGLNGYLVPIKSPADLAEAMHKLACDPELRMRMGQASLERVREIYAVEKVNQALLEILELA